MIKREITIVTRYALAIAVTAGFMIWQTFDGALAREESASGALFWLISVAGGWLQMGLIARGVRSAFDVRQLPGWTLLLLSALIGAVPLTFEIRWLVDTLVKPEGGLPSPWVTYANVSFINVNFSLVQFLFVERWPLTTMQGAISADERTNDSGTDEEGSKSTHPSVNLLRQKPEQLEGTILYMKMEDHYLNVHTDQGHGLTLCRMSDAAHDLALTDGLRVHRSWWVARAAVVSIQQENRKRTILVKDGVEIPIGRSYEKALLESGWF